MERGVQQNDSLADGYGKGLLNLDELRRAMEVRD